MGKHLSLRKRIGRWVDKDASPTGNETPGNIGTFSPKNDQLSPSATTTNSADSASRAASVSREDLKKTDVKAPHNANEKEERPVSLWDRAYDSLKEEKPELMRQYEDLLSRVIIGAGKNIPESPPKIEDEQRVQNQIPQHDAVERRQKLNQISELGLKHMEDKNVTMTLLGHRIVLQDAVEDVSKVVSWAQTYIQDAVSGVPYAAAVMAGISLVLPLLQNPVTVEAANREGFTYVTSQMRYYIEMESLLLPEDMASGLKDDLTERVVDLYKLIVEFQVESILRFYRSRTKNYFRNAINYDSWDKKLQDIKINEKEIDEKFEKVMSSTSVEQLKKVAEEAKLSRQQLNNILSEIKQLVHISYEQRDIMARNEQRLADKDRQQLLGALQATDPRLDKKRIVEDKGDILRDSFCWILDNDQFKQWRNYEYSQLLWITGDPGKGKTMLLCGIIDELAIPRDKMHNLSFFLCQASDHRINNAAAVLRGLIYMLVEEQPSLMTHVRESCGDAGNQRFQGPNAWIALCELFETILQDSQLERTYLIIDALDECIGQLNQLLNLIVKVSSAHSHVKWVVSSRNWPSIEKKLERIKDIRLSLELNAKSVAAAVDVYIESKVELLADENEYDDATRNLVRAYLSSNADGTFLWVALVCKRLDGTSRWEVDENFLAAFPPGLDDLYKKMLGQICESRYDKLCKDILAVASLVYRPVTLNELTSLVEFPAKADQDLKAQKEIIGLCGSFLILRERTVYFVHQSAKDFLLHEKASSVIFPDGLKVIQHDIFSKSLKVMAATLRRDVYGLKAPGCPIDQVNTPEPDPLDPVHYSCIYWVDHLYDCARSEVTGIDDDGPVGSFFRRDFLHWLEALSLLRNLSGGLSSLFKLESLLQNTVESSPLLDRVRDACRFVQYHKFGIEGFPLQVYASALAFSPSSSITRNQFETEMVEFIVKKPATEENWGACLQILHGHTGVVNSVAWSPDGVRIASASSDRLVKVWDSVTGQCILTIKGHSDMINSVAWSPDGTQIVSASADYTVRTWDSMTGECLLLLQEHKRSVASVNWSYDGACLASSSQDRTIKIWDSTTGQCISTLTGHGSKNSAAVFSWSPTSRTLIDGYGKIWNVESLETPEDILTFVSDSRPAMSVNWSDDGIKIAKFLYEKQGNRSYLSIWFSATGQCLSTLPFENPFSSRIFWSCTSTRLAMVSNNRNISIWDVETGQLVSTVGAHEYAIDSIAWSHDGVRLASGSRDHTVKIWQLASPNSPALESEYSWKLKLPELSLDGIQLASTSYESPGTINILDIATGQHRWTLPGDGVIKGLAWSSAGTWLASWDHNAIKIWNIALGQCAQTLQVDTGIIRYVAWTLDECQRRLVSASIDCVRIWDTVTGHCSSIIPDCEASLVAWAPDGTQLAIAKRCRIGVWAIETKKWIFENSISEEILNTFVQIIWSRDGTQVLSSSWDGTVRIWDIIAVQCLSAFSFSPGSFQYLDSYSSLRDSLSLHADIGAFEVQWRVAAPDSNHERKLSDLVPVGYGLDSSRTWITYNGGRLLLIPPEYRPPGNKQFFSRVFGSAVTIITLSGRAVRLEFAEGDPFHSSYWG